MSTAFNNHNKDYHLLTYRGMFLSGRHIVNKHLQMHSVRSLQKTQIYANCARAGTCQQYDGRLTAFYGHAVIQMT